jgi:hypothetical protein
MESLVTLTITGNKCIKNRFEKFENFQHFFKKCGGVQYSIPLSGARTLHDLPLDLRICHGKFGNDSAYRDRTHKGQTDKQTNILLYIYRFF